MKRSTFMMMFIGANISFVMLHIYKHSQLIKISYVKQRHEQEKNNLIGKKQELEQQLCALKNHSTIKQRAVQELMMQEINLRNVKNLTL